MIRMLPIHMGPLMNATHTLIVQRYLVGDIAKAKRVSRSVSLDDIWSLARQVGTVSPGAFFKYRDPGGSSIDIHNQSGHSILSIVTPSLFPLSFGVDYLFHLDWEKCKAASGSAVSVVVRYASSKASSISNSTPLRISDH